MKNNLKHFYLQECHQNAQLQIFIKGNITVGKITKKLPRTTTFAQWPFYKGVLKDEHLPKTTTFKWYQEWSSYTGLAVCGIKYKYCDCFLEYTNFKDDLTECKCLCCNKSSQRKFDKILKDLFFNTNKFSNHNNNQFILLLQKGVYPNECMDD